jgi:NAD(P)H-dependent flavin oxidoreductase YrpB (nitropropane dioxygenase family)
MCIRARQMAAGVDLLVAQGSEAGGHTGTISSMVLWPQVVDAAAPLPVLAAGGIGRGRQMAAALALGAEGVWCGSIWLGTTESELTADLRERFYAARSEDAVQSRAITGKPCRTLKSRFTEAYEQPGAPKPLPMPLQSIAITEARLRFERAHAKEWLSYPVGQIVGDMKGDTTVRQVVQEMLAEFADSVERLGTLIDN